jgi:hypothetical protein
LTKHHFLNSMAWKLSTYQLTYFIWLRLQYHFLHAVQSTLLFLLFKFTILTQIKRTFYLAFWLFNLIFVRIWLFFNILFVYIFFNLKYILEHLLIIFLDFILFDWLIVCIKTCILKWLIIMISSKKCFSICLLGIHLINLCIMWFINILVAYWIFWNWGLDVLFIIDIYQVYFIRYIFLYWVVCPILNLFYLFSYDIVLFLF